MTKDELKVLISVEFVIVVLGQMPELFGSINIAMMEFFDDRYAALSKVASSIATVTVAAVGIGGGAFQYRDFDNM